MPRTLSFMAPEWERTSSFDQQPELDIVTCEYPPMLGGIADYTRTVAERLDREGCATRIWGPGVDAGDAAFRANCNLSKPKVMRTFGSFGLRDIWINERLFGNPDNRCLLLQWEPVGFGQQSINLPFCLWIASRALRGTSVLIMFHETFLPFKKRSLKRFLAGSIQRLMAFALLNTASTVFASTESGTRSLQTLCFRPGKVQHLPVFSNIEKNHENSEQVERVRRSMVAGQGSLIGHFGRYMANSEPLVVPAVGELLRRQENARFVFIGECGARYRDSLLRQYPDLGARVFSSGVGTPEEITNMILACDFLFQPYPGGLTTKRSSTMAALAHGRCVVSNRGPETEALWNECAGVTLADGHTANDLAGAMDRLLGAPAEVIQRNGSTVSFYRANFSSEHAVDAFLSGIQTVSTNADCRAPLTS